MKKRGAFDLRYRLILSDIDGTLLNSNHQLTDEVKTAIKEYAAAGGTFVLASARPPLAMTALAHQMGLDATCQSQRRRHLPTATWRFKNPVRNALARWHW